MILHILVGWNFQLHLIAEGRRDTVAVAVKVEASMVVKIIQLTQKRQGVLNSPWKISIRPQRTSLQALKLVKEVLG